jgi:2-oxoglutarate ferredoxin oxidoreductase subunit gamma
MGVAKMHNILIAGFGGQGILFCGRYIIQAAMLIGKEVSWMPSYGPEMRGGTANCSLIISDKKIGSPIVDKPNILIVMNSPSLDKFEDACTVGAKVFIDSSIIEREGKRSDIEYFYIPATKFADEKGLNGLANIIMAGKCIKELNLCSYDILKEAMIRNVPARKKDLLDSNMQAIDIGLKL